MADLPFLDTNLFLRHLTQDNPIQSPKATALWLRIMRGEERVTTAETVIIETVDTLQHRHQVDRACHPQRSAAAHQPARRPARQQAPLRPSVCPL